MKPYNMWSLVTGSFHLVECLVEGSFMLTPVTLQREKPRLREGREMTWVMCPAGNRTGT